MPGVNSKEAGVAGARGDWSVEGRSSLGSVSAPRRPVLRFREVRPEQMLHFQLELFRFSNWVGGPSRLWPRAFRGMLVFFFRKSLAWGAAPVCR